MNRKLTAPALALALLGGVYMASGTANASNMGFKLERSFSHEAGLRNIYFVSFPLFNGVGDVCDETNMSNVCTGQDGLAGDGRITACDAICDLWTDRTSAGTAALVSMSRIDDACTFRAAQVSLSFLGTFMTAGQGTLLEDYTDLGWQMQYTQNVDTENRSVIVGSHDPSFTGRAVPSFDSCSKSIINLPYHSMYQTAYEILCGLEGSAWVDLDLPPNGPDTCPEGIYDEVSGASISVSTFASNAFTAATALDGFFGLEFPANDYNLEPGQAYITDSTLGYTSRNFLSPHF